MFWHDFVVITLSVFGTRLWMYFYLKWQIRRVWWECPFGDLGIVVIDKKNRQLVIDNHLHNHRECKGGNSNICVAEGCFNDECITNQLKKDL